MFSLKCFKKSLIKKRLLKLMNEENKIVQQYCSKRDCEGANKYLHNNKASFLPTLALPFALIT